jgi:hypothetical protein
MKNILRQSKVYPTFHWSREMLGVVKDMRTALKEKFDDKHYVRIRPEERDGKWRIKADVKAKDSNEKFRLGATWEVPPMCQEIRKRNPGWLAPTWAQVAAGAGNAAADASAMED